VIAALVQFLVCIVLITAFSVVAIAPEPAYAQSWPSTWLLIDTDPNESGAQNYRDVSGAYFNYDSSYLYLRLETYAAAQITGVTSRFKWFIDVGNGNNLYWSGQNILGSDFLLFLEDDDNNGVGEVYLLNGQADDRYLLYEPVAYKTNPGPITQTSTANYNIVGNDVYLWISLSSLGVSDLTHVSLLWSTDNQNPNLEQGPVLDSADIKDTPIHLDADLNIMKDVNNHTPSEGDPITYTVTITNTGPATATNIQITDQLPVGVTYVAPYSASQGTWDNVSGIWSVGSLANGATATLTINATVNAGTTGQTITNTATVTAADQPDPHTGDNTDSADILPGGSVPQLADLHLLKDVSNHLPNEGDTITYTITVTNTGPDNATGVQVTDPLPGGVTYVSHSASQGSYNSGTDVWSVGNLADGGSSTLTITVTVNNGTAGSTISNTATATITTPPPNDPHPADNSDTAEFFVPQAPPPPSTGAPIFPNLYTGVATAFIAAIIAFIIRKRIVPKAL
jgi:uncharacterized repeat protein (TIGR01451 family)